MSNQHNQTEIQNNTGNWVGGKFGTPLEWEKRVKTVFEILGFIVTDFGQEAIFGTGFRSSLRSLDTDTALLLRFLPDYAVTHPSKGTYLVEVKSATEKNKDHDFYNYTLASFTYGLRLAEAGLKIIVIFNGGGEWRADFIDNLQVVKVFDNEEKLKNVAGSGKPYVTFLRKGIPKLLDFLITHFKESPGK